VDAVVAVGFAIAEKAARIIVAKRHRQIVKPDPDKARPGKKTTDRFHTLADHLVRACKRLVDTGLGRNGVAHFVVLETDHNIRRLLQRQKRIRSLLPAAFPFEAKRHGGERNDEGALFLCQRRNEARGSGTGAATKADAKKCHPDLFESLSYLSRRLLACRVAEFRIAATAKTTRGGASELDFFRSHRAGERLHVGVQRNKPGILKTVQSDPVQRVGTGAADAGDLDFHGVV